jgi:hypothetical protein
MDDETTAALKHVAGALKATNSAIKTIAGVVAPGHAAAIDTEIEKAEAALTDLERALHPTDAPSPGSVDDEEGYE